MHRAKKTGERFSVVYEHEGYIRVEWYQGTSVTNRDAQELLKCFEELTPVCAPMLVNLNDMVIVSASALSTFASRFGISALALVGPSAVDRAIAMFFNEVHNPPYPSRYFQTATEARRWLLRPHHHAVGSA